MNAYIHFSDFGVQISELEFYESTSGFFLSNHDCNVSIRCVFDYRKNKIRGTFSIKSFDGLHEKWNDVSIEKILCNDKISSATKKNLIFNLDLILSDLFY